MRVLVTGGAGFIGSHLCDDLIARDCRVIALDDLSTGSRHNVAHLLSNPRFTLIKNRAEGPILQEQVAAADLVFHLAATVGVFNVIQHVTRTITNNIETTLEVLQAARKSKTKVVLASTSEVYGKSRATPFQEDGDLVLGSTSRGRWSYAASKIVDEFLALAYWQQHDVPTVVVRLFNTIGPRQVGKHGMVVPRFLRQAIRHENLTVYGDGHQTRCFVFVSDVIEWLWLLALDDQANGQVFNLGNPQETTILELAQRVISITGSQAGIDFVPYSRAYDSGFEEMQRRIPDTEKVVALTRYTPRVGLDDALHQILDWIVGWNDSGAERRAEVLSASS